MNLNTSVLACEKTYELQVQDEFTREAENRFNHLRARTKTSQARPKNSAAENEEDALSDDALSDDDFFDKLAVDDDETDPELLEALQLSMDFSRGFAKKESNKDQAKD